MGLIILVVILIIILVIFRDLRSFLYAFAISDIILRIIDFVCTQIEEANELLGKLPDSIAAMISSESSGTLETILLWVYVGLYVLFLSYLIPSFFRRKRRKR